MPEGHRPSVLCIEDPLIPGNDIGRSSYGVLQVRQAFEYAYIVLSQGVNPLNTLINDPNKHSILGRVVRITDDVIQYRKYIRKRFSRPRSCESTIPGTVISKAHPLDFTVPVLDNEEYNRGKSDLNCQQGRVSLTCFPFFYTLGMNINTQGRTK